MSLLGHPESVVAKAPKQTAVLTAFCGAAMILTATLLWKADESWWLLSPALLAAAASIIVMSMALVRIATGRTPE
jgi:hypothetical protein